MSNNDLTCAWSGTIGAFINTSQSTWLACLEDHHQKCMNEPASSSQIRAWKNCFDSLQLNLKQLPFAEVWTIIFEYELPRERGRRPDVLILTSSHLFVLEFKDFSGPRQAHIDQVSAYARDLSHYHAQSHSLETIPILVLTLAHNYTYEWKEVHVVSVDKLSQTLADFRFVTPHTNPQYWLSSDYEPLPTLVAAAQTLFQNEPLPQIRRAQSAGIPETIAELFQIAQQARLKNERHLALIMGVPGAGKTLVGLQFVYEYEQRFRKREAVFLSGNGPLVKVLQYALKNKVFVLDVHGFLKSYGGNTQKLPEERIWIYDEAQRAWDADRVFEKRGHNASEPEDFLRIGERSNAWALLIGLIGEGQEIHLGEEAGIAGWNQALGKMTGSWTIHVPPTLEASFNASGIVRTYVSGRLTLNQSLRTHVAEDVQQWIAELLNGNLERAAYVAERVRTQGFDMYLTHNLEAAKGYVRERYEGQPEKRYGLLASSKAQFDASYGIRNLYNFTKNFREGPWYVDPVTSANSCCALIEVATEFACQGLELDFPIVCWGSDLSWNGNTWRSPVQSRSKAQDPHQLRINSYRVLLSRGRDGFIVFLPNEPVFEQTKQALLKAGLISRG